MRLLVRNFEAAIFSQLNIWVVSGDRTSRCYKIFFIVNKSTIKVCYILKLMFILMLLLNLQFEGRKTQMVFLLKTFYNNFWTSYHEMPIFMVQT